MAERVWIRLVGDADEHLLPDGTDLESFRALPDSSWVDLGDGRWCRMNAIAEARAVEIEESEPLPDGEDMRQRQVREALEAHDKPEPLSPPDYNV